MATQRLLLCLSFRCLAATYSTPVTVDGGATANATQPKALEARAAAVPAGNDAVVPCPCDPTGALCRSLSPQPTYKQEVMAYHVNLNGGIEGDSTTGREWQTYDLTKVTSIALFAPLEPELFCAAHRHGVRILDWTNFIGSQNPNPFNNPDMLLSPAKIATWIDNSVAALVAHGYDGALLDIEVGFSDAPHRDGLKAAICGLKAKLDTAIPGSMVAFATAYYIQGNPYDYAAIAACGVVLMPMTYCNEWIYNATATKIPSRRVAGACNPLTSLANELEAYTRAGVKPSQVVPVLPWFGVRFTCMNASGDPFDGRSGCQLGPAGDATGTEGMGYGHVMRILAHGSDTVVGPSFGQVNYTPGCAGGKASAPHLHHESAASVFDIFSDSPPCHHQLWFDSPESLPLKYEWLRSNGFGGFGIWDADMVASVDGYWGPVRNKTTGKLGPSACDDDPATPRCAEEWNQTLINGVAMWGAVPTRTRYGDDATRRADQSVAPRLGSSTAAASGVLPSALSGLQGGQNCVTVRASASDSAIQDFGRPGHLACAPAVPASRWRNKLVLFLPGTRLTPQNYTLFAATASRLGFHVLSLSWANWGCRPTSGVPTCMNKTLYVDPGVEGDVCTRQCYAGPLRGSFARLGNTTANPNNLTRADGILHRLQQALIMLGKTDPSWLRFTDATADEEVEGGVLWSRVVVAGHSLVSTSPFFCVSNAFSVVDSEVSVTTPLMGEVLCAQGV